MAPGFVPDGGRGDGSREGNVLWEDEMEPVLKQRYVAELRSGRHQQGYVRFESRDGRKCPLGVLCVVMGRPTHDPEFPCMGNWNAVRGVLSDDETNRIWHMNDFERRSFDEIADWVEETL